MFIDVTMVVAKAGVGGNGIVSFHRTRGNSFGGPDGGDGGDGGNIVFIASNNENTLANFRYQKELKAEDGQAGMNGKKHGRNGRDLEIKVPVGTQVRENGQLIADLTDPGQTAVIAQGGKGGFGNAHFTSSTRQAPRVAEKGEEGEERTCQLELKMIADVGLVGLPNAGKSTLLARISNARPEIADYAFTTLRPNLGVAQVEKGSELLVADIPGLIEGASEGKGLGDEFLRHVERTKVLVHLIDAYSDNVAEAYTTIQNELKAYKIDMSKKPQLIAINKIDGLDSEIIDDIVSQLKKVAKKSEVYAISAQSGDGVQKLLYAVSIQVEKLRKKMREEELKQSKLPVIRVEASEDPWKVAITEDAIYITGAKIERFAAKTDFSSEDAERRLRDIMRKMGIMKELEKKNAIPGLPIYFGKKRVDHLEY